MYLLIFLSYNTFCHLRLIYHMRLVLGDYRDFSCKMSLAIKIWLQTLVENTQFSSSDPSQDNYSRQGIYNFLSCLFIQNPITIGAIFIWLWCRGLNFNILVTHKLVKKSWLQLFMHCPLLWLVVYTLSLLLKHEHQMLVLGLKLVEFY